MREDRWQVLPELTETEFSALKQDIASHGVLVPIEVDEHGQILDGHHRLKAWQELRGEGRRVPDYPRLVRRFQDDDERLAHVLALNLARRHLSPAQRQELVVGLRGRGWSLRRIAEAVRTGTTTVHRDLAGVPNGTGDGVDGDDQAGGLPEEVQGADQKRYPARRPVVIAASAAEQKRAEAALSIIGEAESHHLLDVRQASEKARIANMSRRRQEGVAPLAEGPLWRIEHADFREIDIAADSVDAVICDPPYTTEAIPLWADLGAFAARVLKPGRVLVCYAGHRHLPEEISYLGEHLEWVWSGVTVQQGRHSVTRDRQIFGWHRPWLILSKGPYQPRGFIYDLVRAEGSGVKEMTDHPWRQTLGPFRELVRMFTKPGELVVDPFLGQGTTAVAALQEGRRFLGCDVDAAAVSMTLERLRTEVVAEDEAGEAR